MSGDEVNVFSQRLRADVHVPPQLADVVLGREGWQNLLYPREPVIEIFEMCGNHVLVHWPHLLEKDGGERTAILASSGRRNARTVKAREA
jgi:hypothetical protein